MLLDTGKFSLVNSGNRTLGAPKRSWKVDLGPGDDEVAGMSRLNLKSMYNDPSQMREALAWQLFGRPRSCPPPGTRTPSSAINDGYRGLFALIEQVDRAFLKEHFGGQLPTATSTRPTADRSAARRSSTGSAPTATTAAGSTASAGDDPTYRLKTYADDGGANSYDDLAQFVRSDQRVGLPGGDDRFATDAFARFGGRSSRRSTASCAGPASTC